MNHNESHHLHLHDVFLLMLYLGETNIHHCYCELQGPRQPDKRGTFSTSAGSRSCNQQIENLLQIWSLPNNGGSEKPIGFDTTGGTPMT